jgi:acyl-CoA thioester hydrolase
MSARMSRAALHEAETVINVPFHDVDAAGIVWHGHYVKYLEIARCVLLDKIDYSYNRMLESGYIWPVIDMQLRYVKAVKFAESLHIRARLIEWEHRLKLDYLISNASTGARVCKAWTVQVAVNARSGEMCLRSPDVLLELLGVGN